MMVETAGITESRVEVQQGFHGGPGSSRCATACRGLYCGGGGDSNWQMTMKLGFFREPAAAGHGRFGGPSVGVAKLVTAKGPRESWFRVGGEDVEAVQPDQALKLSPHEQVLAALGFLNLKPPSFRASR